MALTDLVAALVTDELQQRQDRLLARRHKQVRFATPNARSLDGFDFAFNEKINRALVFELATARFVWGLLVFAVTMPSPLDLRARLVAVGYPGGQLLGERARVEHGVNPYGRPESRTTMCCWLRETTSVIVAVQEPPGCQ